MNERQIKILLVVIPVVLAGMFVFDRMVENRGSSTALTVQDGGNREIRGNGGNGAFIPKMDVGKQKGVLNLERQGVSVKEESPGFSQTVSYNDYSNSPSFEDFIRQRGYKSWDEVAGDYGTKPDLEDAKNRQTRQKWIALAKAGAAGLSQLSDIVGNKKGASVRLKNYDLGGDNLQEAKREEAVYHAKMQDYFKKAAEYEKALQKDYSDFLNKSAVKVSETETAGKRTITQDAGVRQEQKRKEGGGTNNSGEAKRQIVSGISPYTKTENGKKTPTNVKYSYDKSNPNIIPAVYAMLFNNKDFLINDLKVNNSFFEKENLFFGDGVDRLGNVNNKAITASIDALYSESSRILDEIESLQKNRVKFNNPFYASRIGVLGEKMKEITDILDYIENCGFSVEF